MCLAKMIPLLSRSPNHIIRLLDRHQSESGWRWTFILQSWCGHIFDGFYFDGHICDGLPFSFISWSESSEHIFVPLVEAAFQAILRPPAWEMILIMVKILTFDRNYNQKVLAHFSSVCSHRLVTLFAQWDGSSAASFILLLCIFKWIETHVAGFFIQWNN